MFMFLFFLIRDPFMFDLFLLDHSALCLFDLLARKSLFLVSHAKEGAHSIGVLGNLVD